MSAPGSHRPLEGRRACVTGGAKGIGAGIAQALTTAGADVLIADLDKEAAAAQASAIGASFVQLDVSDSAAVQETLARLGPFAILVNNAGVDQHAFFTDTTPADWRRLIDINLISIFACTHAVLPAMQAAGFGRIITIASEAGRLGSKGGAVYSAAKGGAIAFMKSIARENARFAITANTIAPGPIRTPLLEQAIAQKGERLLKTLTGATLLGRLGDPNEVAAAALFLASNDASFITGETLGVSGGMGIGA